MSERRTTTRPGADLSVLVMGMHRSGTSAVAGVLHDAGISAGPDESLVPPLPENPRFYGERPDVVRLNDRLLAALGWSWDAPAAAPDASPPPLDELVAEGRSLAKTLLAGPVGLVKDPRISVLLPWWRRMTLDRFVAVVPLRAPEEVAWSLTVRDGLPFELGLALWMAYHRHLAAGLDGLPVVVVDFDALTTDPAPVVVALIDELGRLGVGDGLDVASATAAIQPTLRRTTQPTAGDDALLASARASAAAWTNGPVHAFDRFSMVTVAPAGWEVALLDLQRRYRQAAAVADRAQRSRDELDTIANDARAAASAATAAKTHAEAAAEAARAAAEAARADADAARADGDAARADGDVARAEAVAAREELERVRADADALRLEIAVIAAEDARTDAAAARDEARTAREEAGVALADATTARHSADQALAQATAANEESRVAHADADSARSAVTVALTAHGSRTRTLAQLPVMDGLRHTARRVSDVLADLPVTSALQRNPLFDAQWYLERYPDVRAAGLDPWRHYRRHGVAEGRDPNAWFRTQRYLDDNPDVRASGMNPLDHYLRHGAAEGRGPTSPAGGTHHPRAGEHDGGGSDPPARSGLDGRRTRPALRPTPTTARRESARLERWLRAMVPARLPRGSTVLTMGGASHGRIDGLTLASLDGVVSDGPAPRETHRSDTALVARMEWQRSRGAAFLALQVATPDILEPLPRLRRHLEQRFPVVEREPEIGTLWDLRAIAPAMVAGPGGLATAIDRLRPDPETRLALLDRTASGAGDGLQHVQVLRADPAVPWPPGSVDVVLQDEGAPDEEARGIATRAVITVPLDTDAPLAVHRLDGDPAVTPRVTIVIPHHGPLEVLRTCLRSLRETTTDVPELEVLVIDDATPGLTMGELEACVGELPGGRLLVNDTNAGFLATANRGAAEATGEVIVLLNNDTLTLPGWLPPLLETFREHPDAGVVGGRLVYPDGRLQEAGGLVFRDGSAAKFGYGDPDPDAPMYTFLRETDYVSGALLATPRALFQALGGLDVAFGFGFYEDTDYCFRVRRAGRLVLYQPRSVIVHVEGATTGTDPSVGPKRSQVVNEALFRERWADVLRSRPHRPMTVRPEDWYAAAIAAPEREVVAA